MSHPLIHQLDQQRSARRESLEHALRVRPPGRLDILRHAQPLTPLRCFFEQTYLTVFRKLMFVDQRNVTFWFGIVWMLCNRGQIF